MSTICLRTKAEEIWHREKRKTATGKLPDVHDVNGTSLSSILRFTPCSSCVDQCLRVCLVVTAFHSVAYECYPPYLFGKNVLVRLRFNDTHYMFAMRYTYVI